MSDHERTVPVFVDFLPSHAGHPAGRDAVVAYHRQWLESHLEGIIARQAKVPVLMVQDTSESVRLVVDLLLEARTLFYFGHYYSCVAMCGIVAERIIKDVLRNNVLAIGKSGPARPPEKAFDQLERVEIRNLINFAAECDLFTDDVKAAATKLGELRNQYAHARGREPEADAIKAIEHLHAIVGGTVSILKDFEIRDGVLVRRQSATRNTDKRS